MSLSAIMNSTTLYIAVIVGLLLIFLLCAVMLKMAWGRCIELGISQEKIKGVIKSSVIFSIVPSLSIVIGLFSLAAVLGVPWPWFRLSVVGSVSYELMAADMVATGAGYESIGALAAANDASQAGAIMFVMSIGIMFGIVTCTFFGKKIQTSMTSFREKNGAWGALATGCFTLALMVVFLPPLWLHICTALLSKRPAGPGFPTLCWRIRWYWQWLPRYSLPICLRKGVS